MRGPEGLPEPAHVPQQARDGGSADGEAQRAEDQPVQPPGRGPGAGRLDRVGVDDEARDDVALDAALVDAPQDLEGPLHTSTLSLAAAGESS